MFCAYPLKEYKLEDNMAELEPIFEFNFQKFLNMGEEEKKQYMNSINHNLEFLE